ncbi:ABC transporter ATP-binding protein [Isoptericola variabilis]|uniref:Phosphonate-transporting ATPase n=1 Tax=Isoptericola variabilis (strain 225) TaxID=743718 RepID=F6FU43_ISOV2|nr:ABC transporter ATP-binding protein [Isoptericola variabilis]AEG43239.1 Phosphonate-transporting ATPase [Isoptericola variabilis 225]TWH35174.1 putative ABC transport system ATP-binding protein [Isoptericola variabilis J7]
MTPILSARNLTLRYPGGTAPALDAVDLDVAPGESVAIMGASGSGKTTLLHCLAGILRPTGGSVTFASGAGLVHVESLDDDGRARLRREELGFVFQQGLLLDELSALENVAVARMLAGVPRAQAEAEAARWLAHLGLAGLEQRRLGELSGGQAQRVAIARAQVGGARLLFADEPTGALDSATSAEVLDLLLDAVREGRTLVVVTHDPDVAARCARTVVLRDGRVVSDTAREHAADRASVTGGAR